MVQGEWVRVGSGEKIGENAREFLLCMGGSCGEVSFVNGGGSVSTCRRRQPGQ